MCLNVNTKFPITQTWQINEDNNTEMNVVVPSVDINITGFSYPFTQKMFTVAINFLTYSIYTLNFALFNFMWFALFKRVF